MSHYHKSSGNKMHTHRLSVFHNNVVSQADLSYLCVFGMYITVCKKNSSYVRHVVIYITRIFMGPGIAMCPLHTKSLRMRGTQAWPR